MRKTLQLVKFELKEAFSYARFRYKDTITAISFLIFSVYVIYNALRTYIFNEEILSRIIIDVFSTSLDVRKALTLGIVYLFILALTGSILSGAVSLPRSLKFLQADTLILRSAPISTESIFTAKFIRYIIKRSLYIAIAFVAVGIPFATYWGFESIEAILLFGFNVTVIALIIIVAEAMTFFITRVINYQFKKTKHRILYRFGTWILLGLLIVGLFQTTLLFPNQSFIYLFSELIFPTLFNDRLNQINISLILILDCLVSMILILITIYTAKYYFSELEPFNEESELRWRNLFPGYLKKTVFNLSISKSLMAKDLVLSLRTNLPRFFFFSIALLFLIFLTKPSRLISLQDIAKDISITYGLLSVVAFVIAIMPIQLILIENDREMLWLIKTLPFESRIFFKTKHLFGFYLNALLLTPIAISIIMLHPTLRTILAVIPVFLALTYIYNVLIISDTIRFMPMEENRDFSIIAVLIVVMKFIIYSFPVLILSFAATIFIPFQIVSLPLLAFYTIVIREISYENAKKELIAKEVL